MKYEQPYGVSDPNASYINGNPPTGTMGSIPPAASIENPQREVVNTISDAGLVPTDADLSQLAKAIQSGQLNFKHDTGTANAYAALMTPSPGSYFEGLGVILKIANSNTGASVLNLNSLGNKPIVRSDGVTPLSQGDLTVNGFVLFLYDGTSFRIVWTQSAATTGAGIPIYLTAPRDYYINGTTGDDNYDGSQATVGTGIHGPFKTLQRAANQIPLYNLNGWNITMHVADGTYTGGVTQPRANGSGNIYWLGNTTTPANCSVPTTNRSAFILNNLGCTTYIDGFKVSCVGSQAGDGMCSINAYGATSIVILGAMEFGPTQGAHISTENGSLVSNTVPGVAWKISGSALGSAYEPGCFIFAYVQGNFINNSGGGPAITITAGVNLVGAFVTVSNVSFVQLVMASLTGTCTGQKYNCQYNSSISTGSGNVNYYPGSIAGTVANGGYYT